MLPANRDEAVVTEFLTVKDVIELVGKQPHDVRMEGKWARLVFDRCSVRLKVS